MLLGYYGFLPRFSRARVNWASSHFPLRQQLFRITCLLAVLSGGVIRLGAQNPTFAGDAQHTAQYEPAAQRLNQIRWSTAIDLRTSGAAAHYAAPLVTP